MVKIVSQKPWVKTFIYIYGLLIDHNIELNT
jgi:hypothetical protein